MMNFPVPCCSGRHINPVAGEGTCHSNLTAYLQEWNQLPYSTLSKLFNSAYSKCSSVSFDSRCIECGWVAFCTKSLFSNSLSNWKSKFLISHIKEQRNFHPFIYPYVQAKREWDSVFKEMPIPCCVASLCSGLGFALQGYF